MSTETSVPVVESEVEVDVVSDEQKALTADERGELEHLRTFRERLSFLEESASDAHCRVDAIKQELKEAKLEAEAADAAIRRLLREEKNDAERPLLKLAGDASSADGEESDESWRSISIDELGLPAKVCESLRENVPSLATVGAISDWANTPDANGRHKQLTDVKGIGAAKATQIDEALDRVWKQRKVQADAAPKPLQEWEMGGDPLGCDEEDYDEEDE